MVKAGSSVWEFIHVNHSIADAVAFAIKTPVGTCIPHRRLQDRFHPIQGGMIDLARLGGAGEEGRTGPPVRLHQRGAARLYQSEAVRTAPLSTRCSATASPRIIVTTFASNVDRIQQVISVRGKYGRKGGRYRPQYGRMPCGSPSDWAI